MAFESAPEPVAPRGVPVELCPIAVGQRPVVHLHRFGEGAVEREASVYRLLKPGLRNAPIFGEARSALLPYFLLSRYLFLRRTIFYAREWLRCVTDMLRNVTLRFLFVLSAPFRYTGTALLLAGLIQHFVLGLDLSHDVERAADLLGSQAKRGEFAEEVCGCHDFGLRPT